MKAKLWLVLSHLVALTILVWAIFPLAHFYFSGLSAFGDYFVGYAFADYLKNHFVLPPASWIYSQAGGVPIFSFYQWLSFYLMQPLVAVFGTGWGLEIFSFTTLILFFFFSYLLYWQLSRNAIIAAFLVVILYFTLGVLNPLMQSGFLTQNAIAFLMPLILWLLLLYYRKGNRKFFILAATLQGLALVGHSGIAIFLILAPAGLSLFFWWDEKVSLFSWQKIKDSFVYGIIAFLVGAPAVLIGILQQLGPGGGAHCETGTCVASMAEINPYFNYWALWVAAGMVVIALFWSLAVRRNCLKIALPYLALLAFVAAYLLSTHYRLKITDSLSTFLWPLRCVWVLSLGLGAVAAALFGQIRGEGKLQTVALILKTTLTLVCLVVCGWMIYFKPYDAVPLFEKNRQGYEASGPSIFRFTVDKYRTGVYKNYSSSMLLPEWLPPNDLNYRIDSLWGGDFGFWPLISTVPQVRFYAGTSSPKFDNWRSWLASAETDQLGEKANRSLGRESNLNQALFMIDWYAIRYLNTSIDFISKLIGRDFPFAPYLENETVTDRHEEKFIGFEGEDSSKKFSIYFDYRRVREELTSPIIKGSNAPTIFFVGDEQSWANFVRALGLSNTNSRQLIPVKGPELLEKVELDELKKFDMVVLYAYNYDDFSSAWKAITDYVQEGGVLFIDTGREVKETSNQTLPSGVKGMPEIIPAQTLTKLQLGEKWNLTASDSPITKDIQFEQFSPLLFGESQWTLSAVADDSSFREGSQVILRQSGKAVLATRNFGKGRILWSGLNLPYYILNYQAVPEAKLLRQIIAWGVGELTEGKPVFKTQRPKPEKVIVTGNDFKGVVFKDSFNSGWQAKVNGKGVKLYQAGPDVIYVPVPKSSKNPLKVEINYRGTLFKWIVFIISLVTLIVGLKYGLTGNLWKSRMKVLDGWWSKEGE